MTPGLCTTHTVGRAKLKKKKKNKTRPQPEAILEKQTNKQTKVKGLSLQIRTHRDAQ